MKGRDGGRVSILSPRALHRRAAPAHARTRARVVKHLSKYRSSRIACVCPCAAADMSAVPPSFAWSCATGRWSPRARAARAASIAAWIAAWLFSLAAFISAVRPCASCSNTNFA